MIKSGCAGGGRNGGSICIGIGAPVLGGGATRARGGSIARSPRNSVPRCSRLAGTNSSNVSSASVTFRGRSSIPQRTILGSSGSRTMPSPVVARRFAAGLGELAGCGFEQAVNNGTADRDNAASANGSLESRTTVVAIASRNVTEIVAEQAGTCAEALPNPYNRPSIKFDGERR